eukprot:517841-Rhodomonas_salina.1
MSGSDLVYWTTRCTDLAHDVICLRACYGMSSTDLLYGARRYRYHPTQCPVLSWRMVLPGEAVLHASRYLGPAISLRESYGMPGTDLVYAATRRAEVDGWQASQPVP